MKNASYAKRLLDETLQPFNTRANHVDAVDDEDEDQYGDDNFSSKNQEQISDQCHDAEKIIDALEKLSIDQEPQLPEEMPLQAGDWTAVYDETYSAYYFYNSESGETVWEPPAEMKAVGWEYIQDDSAEATQESTPANTATNISEDRVNGLSAESRAALKQHLKELFFRTLKAYAGGQEIVKVGSNGKKYVRLLRLMGRFLVLSSKSVPKSVHVSRIEEIKLGMASDDFNKLLKDIPTKQLEKMAPTPETCCVLCMRERDISLIFPSLETRDSFVFMLRVLRRQAANAATQSLGG